MLNVMIRVKQWRSGGRINVGELDQPVWSEIQYKAITTV